MGLREISGCYNQKVSLAACASVIIISILPLWRPKRFGLCLSQEDGARVIYITMDDTQNVQAPQGENVVPQAIPLQEEVQADVVATVAPEAPVATTEEAPQA